jgi:plastocyanin
LTASDAPRLQTGPSRAGATGRVNPFLNGLKGDGPFGFQPSVFDSRPGSPAWSPYWDHYAYQWRRPRRARLLTSEAGDQRGAPSRRPAAIRRRAGHQRHALYRQLPGAGRRAHDLSRATAPASQLSGGPTMPTRKALTTASVPLIAGLCAAIPASAATRTLKVGDNWFVRSAGVPTVTIKRGDTVRWRWIGNRRHNVTVRSGPARFKSRTQTNGSFSKRLTRRGTYRIICTIHGAGDQSMVLRVR